MEETILLPSPNWFLVSGIAVSSDGWLFYGGPTKTICVLEPLTTDCNVIIREHNGYRAHVFGKVSSEKITSVDVSPAWPEQKCFITGAADGTVKHWILEKNDNAVNIKSTSNHTMHMNEREDVAGVAYSSNNFAVTVGSFGRIVKWDLQSNIVKTYSLILSKFKPTCIACSPHMCLHVALGTKQGIVIVVDLTDTGTILFKVRSHDDEILSLSWCPQYSVSVKKKFNESEPRKSANDRMERIRQEASKLTNEKLNDSALTKTLPDDSFDESFVEEDDMFDIYKDHEEDEFGHKKYTPEVIVVKDKEPIPAELDYLAECQKLKDKILGNNEEPELSINSLVDALDKIHVDESTVRSTGDIKQKKDDKSNKTEFSKQSYKHLLASIGKQGNLHVWSKNGKLLASGLIQNRSNFPNKNQYQKINQPPWGTILWYKPDVLLITDAKGQLLQCNPLVTDCRNKLDWSVVDTIHKRGTFCMISNAPRVQCAYGIKDSNHVQNGEQPQIENESQSSQLRTNTGVVVPEDDWYVWTAAQDRTLLCYSMTKRKKMLNYNTCGALIYNIQACPYDAKKIAVCVGDGAIRIWEADLDEDNEEKLTAVHVTSFWQNVQGKVLVAAWHPTRENIIAFGTAESRVGVLDISGVNVEKPARVLNIGVTGGVYSLSWGDRNDLYVCGGGDIFVYRFNKGAGSKTVSVELEGEKWRLTAANWHPSGLLCGSSNGSVALLSNTTYEIQAVNFLFKKLINSLEWHPQFTTNSSEESSLKNLIAVSSMDKSYRIAILKHSQDEDGKHKLETYKYLEGHKAPVLQLAWSPHDEGRLASTSPDSTVRVWDVESGTCLAIFPGHTNSSISLAWSAFPQFSNVLITGGSDFSVRFWKMDDYPPEAYKENLPRSLIPKKERKNKATLESTAEPQNAEPQPAEEVIEAQFACDEGRSAEHMAIKLKAFKKFLLPITSKQMTKCTVSALRKLAEKHIVKEEKSGDEVFSVEYDTEFLKIFGTTNELNELLDMEMAHHMEAKDTEAWIMLAIFRGQMDSMIKFASENDLLCPFLVSLSPCVSFKYWKDVTQLYLAQINRFIAQKREGQLLHNRSYGGPVFRKAALLLSVHDVKGAVDCLLEARLFCDAYTLCRARHMESIARETLWVWLKDAHSNGNQKSAILCYIALGELYKASTTIVGMAGDDDETWLSLAAELAKMSGQHTFAGHLEDKREQIKQAPKNQEVEDALEQLPSRIELLLKADNGIGNDLNNENVIANGSENTDAKALQE